MSEPVFYTARDDYDARYCDTRFRTIDSTKNTLKLFEVFEGQVQTTSPTYYNYTDIEHNLGYQPYLEVYYNIVGNSIWEKAPKLHYETDPYWYIAEEVSIQRPNNNKITILFLSGDQLAGLGTEETFNYVCKIYINAWEDSWYE